jgi:hypothetical protein
MLSELPSLDMTTGLGPLFPISKLLFSFQLSALPVRIIDSPVFLFSTTPPPPTITTGFNLSSR